MSLKTRLVAQKNVRVSTVYDNNTNLKMNKINYLLLFNN